MDENQEQEAWDPGEESRDRRSIRHLFRGYLKPYIPGGVPALQPRRTLDQYFYTHLDTTAHRDRDQVVYRYTKNSSQVPKMFMVDQLWLWVINGSQAHPQPQMQ